MIWPLLFCFDVSVDVSVIIRNVVVVPRKSSEGSPLGLSQETDKALKQRKE